MRIIPLLLVFSLFAQDSAGTPTKSGTTGSIGTVTLNGQVYNQLSIRPEIPIGKLGVGLDIYLYFNDEGMYWDSWDFSSGGSAYKTIIDKIYYLRWGQPGDNLYFMAGALPSVTLGQGILVNNYSNIMEYPQVRQVGLNLQAKVAGFGIELIHSNFKSATPGVLGIRGSRAIIPKLSLGVSLVTDLDQLAGLPDSDGDNYPDYYDFYPDDATKWDDYSGDSLLFNNLHDYYELENSGISLEDFLNILTVSKSNYSPENATKDPVSGLALDVTYSLSEKVTLYSQVGFLIGEIDTLINENSISYTDKTKLGWGLVPIGVRTKLGPINLLAEYRMGFERFVFNYWDRAYDVNRVFVDASGVSTRESQLYLYGELNGFYVQADMSVMNLFTLSSGYQYMQGEKWDKDLNKYETGETNKTFLSTIAINPSLIPKVGKAEVFYQQSNVPNPFDFTPTPSTLWGYNVGVEVSSGVMLMYKARTTYISDLDNPGEFKPVESIQIETQFIF
jgi:hypothetical protein